MFRVALSAGNHRRHSIRIRGDQDLIRGRKARIGVEKGATT